MLRLSRAARLPDLALPMRTPYPKHARLAPCLGTLAGPEDMSGPMFSHGSQNFAEASWRIALFWTGRKFEKLAELRHEPVTHHSSRWPAPGSEDTELGVFMGPEVRHGETKVYTRVQA